MGVFRKCSWGFGHTRVPPCSGDPRSPRREAPGPRSLEDPGAPGAGPAAAGSEQVPAGLGPGWTSAGGAGGVEGPGSPTGRRCIRLQEAAPGSCRLWGRSAAAGMRLRSEMWGFRYPLAPAGLPDPSSPRLRSPGPPVPGLLGRWGNPLRSQLHRRGPRSPCLRDSKPRRQVPPLPLGGAARPTHFPAPHFTEKIPAQGSGEAL